MKDYEAVLKQVAGRMMHMKQDGIQEKYPVSLLDMEAWEWPQGVGLATLSPQAIPLHPHISSSTFLQDAQTLLLVLLPLLSTTHSHTACSSSCCGWATRRAGAVAWRQAGL